MEIGMNNYKAMRTVLLFLLCICGINLMAQNNTNTVGQKVDVPAVEDGSSYTYYARFDSSIYYTDTIIKWMSFEEAVAAQKKNPKKICMDIYATWCRWCKLSDSVLFKNREIAHFMNQNYYAVRFNAETSGCS